MGYVKKICRKLEAFQVLDVFFLQIPRQSVHYKHHLDNSILGSSQDKSWVESTIGTW